MSQKSTTLALALSSVALLLAVVAAALAWVAYDRTGDSLDKRIEQHANMTTAPGVSTPDASTTPEATPDSSASDLTPNTNSTTVPQTQP